MNEINVIGLGYIGLPTAIMLASCGNKVVGTDINTKVIDKLSRGILTITEKNLDMEFIKARENGIIFKNTVVSANKYIIAVPTPYVTETKKIDPTFIIVALNSILKVCENDSIVVIESTISPGTIDRYIRPILLEFTLTTNKKINIVHAPERIIPGNMIYELVNNSRTIGADSEFIGNQVKSWYATFCIAEIYLTDIKTAELSKVIENTYRDVNIAFANELVKICDIENVNVHELIEIANKHPRVNILSPGPGVGGHCISVDPWFLVGDYPELTDLIYCARLINESMPNYVLKKLRNIMSNHGVHNFGQIGIYGVTYKEDVDDIRESPTKQFLNLLELDELNVVNVYDPFVAGEFEQIQLVNSFERFIEESTIIVIMVAHKHILENANLLSDKIVFDTKNCNIGDFLHMYIL